MPLQPKTGAGFAREHKMLTAILQQATQEQKVRLREVLEALYRAVKTRKNRS